MKTKSSEKSFGILFFVVFTIIGLWPLIYNNPLRLWAIILGIFFLIISLTKPSLFKNLNIYWIKLGEILGRFIAPIVMMIIFFLLITPLSFILKIFGKDVLNIKFNNFRTYWIKRKKDINSMDKQF